MVDIFEEVDEELRRDKYQDLLRKYGPWVLGGALAIIAGAAGYQGWNAWRTAQHEASSDAYVSALRAAEAGNYSLASTGFETLAEDGVGGYPELALLQRGSVALEEGDREAAAGFFDRAARQASDPVIRDLATLKSVWARWDALSFNDIEIRLTPLTGDTSPYRFLAREAIAAAALRDGNLERARETYQLISFGFDAPQGVRQRAQEALAVIASRSATQAPAEAAGGEAEADMPAGDVTEDPAPAGDDENDAGEPGDE